MNALHYVHRVVLPAAYSLLPSHMETREATAMLLAIGLQESRFAHRRQVKGPALSFWQAESGGGFRGVLSHRATGELARDILRRMAYGEPDESDFQALEDNDILACVGARLLLWTVPMPLPAREQPDRAWAYYIAGWRPGRPHRESWDAFFAMAHDLVGGGQ